MGRNINSKSQINVKKPHFIKKANKLKDRSLKHKEKIEASEQVKPVPKTNNLYVSMNRKIEKEILPKKIGNTIYLSTCIWNDDNYDYILTDFKTIKEKFKNGKPRNLHKKGSMRKIKKLRKKHIRQKPDRKRLKNQSKIATPYGECCICLESKEMSKTNIIKCGKVSHVLCAGCKDKIKDNKCPLCRSHPIDPDKEEMVTFTRTPGAGRTDVYGVILTNTYDWYGYENEYDFFDHENDINFNQIITRRRTNLFTNHFQYM